MAVSAKPGSIKSTCNQAWPLDILTLENAVIALSYFSCKIEENKLHNPGMLIEAESPGIINGHQCL